MVAGLGAAGALEVGASVVVVSSDVDVGASVLDVVDSGAEWPTATLVDALLWLATAVPAAASRSTTPTAKARTVLRPPCLSVVVIVPLRLLGEGIGTNRAPLYLANGMAS